MKPSRSIFTLEEAAEELGITILDLLDYGQQGLINVVTVLSILKALQPSAPRELYSIMR